MNNRECTESRFQTGVLVFLLTFLFSFNVFAQSTPEVNVNLPVDPTLPEEVLKGRTVILNKKLMPTTDSEVEIPQLEFYMLNDGSRVIGGGGSAGPNDPPPAFEWSVDPQKGTFTTRRIQPSTLEEVKKIPPQRRLRRQYPPPQLNLDGEQGSSLLNRLLNFITPQAAFAAFIPGIYTHSVTILARDPIGLVVAATFSKLSWGVASWGGMWVNYTDDTCTAVSTVVGTWWYIDDCVFMTPWIDVYTSIGHGHIGTYFNYDFGNPQLRTDVYHYTQINARPDGSWTYYWYHIDSGEFSTLLYGQVFPA